LNWTELWARSQCWCAW